MRILQIVQQSVILISLILLALIVASSAFPLPGALVGMLFSLSFFAVFLVMLIRPLADLFSSRLRLRQLILLRKSFGIFSASIIVGFLLRSLLLPDSAYRTLFATAGFWSVYNMNFFAHIGDITGFILLLTSNAFSQRLLKRNWKRIQRLSYVYFYAGGIYEAFALQSNFALWAVIAITNITVLAWAVKAWDRAAIAKLEKNQDGEVLRAVS